MPNLYERAKGMFTGNSEAPRFSAEQLKAKTPDERANLRASIEQDLALYRQRLGESKGEISPQTGMDITEGEAENLTPEQYSGLIKRSEAELKLFE